MRVAFVFAPPLLAGLLVDASSVSYRATAPITSAPSTPSSPTLTPPYTNGSDCTIQIPSAGLGWWYTYTYRFATADVQFLITEPSDGPANGAGAYATGYTISSRRQPANATQLLQAAETTEIMAGSVLSGKVQTSPTYLTSSTPTPIAAHTTSVVRSRYRSLPDHEDFTTRMGTGRFELPASYTSSLGPAATTLNEAPPAAPCTTITSATPYLRFSNYEVVYGTATSSLDLVLPVGYALPLQDYNGVLTTSGLIPSDFASAVSPYATCKLSIWSAQPTVVVVIEVIYNFQAALAAHIESPGTPSRTHPPPSPHTEYPETGGPSPTGSFIPMIPPPYFTSILPIPSVDVEPVAGVKTSKAVLQVPTRSFVVIAPTGIGVITPPKGDGGESGDVSEGPSESSPRPNEGIAPPQPGSGGQSTPSSAHGTDSTSDGSGASGVDEGQPQSSGGSGESSDSSESSGGGSGGATGTAGGADGNSGSASSGESSSGNESVVNSTLPSGATPTSPIVSPSSSPNQDSSSAGSHTPDHAGAAARSISWAPSLPGLVVAHVALVVLVARWHNAFI